MKRFQKREGGYIGILALVLSLFILAFLYAKFYVFPGSNQNAAEKKIVAEINEDSGTTTAPVSDTRAGQLQGDVGAARAVGNILNDRAGETNDLLKGL